MDVDDEAATIARVKQMESEEPLLQENPRRFVLFPITHPDIWQFYKKAEGTYVYVSGLLSVLNLIVVVASCLNAFGAFSTNSIQRILFLAWLWFAVGTRPHPLGPAH